MNADGFEATLLLSLDFPESLSLNLGGCTVSIQADSEVLDPIRFQSGHLESSEAATESLFILEYGDSMPRLPFKVTETSGSIDGLSFSVLLELGIICVEFEESKNKFVLFRKGRAPTTSDALRVIYQWVIPYGPVPIHGGSVSWGQRAALISSTGGAGKSSLISASVLDGAKTTGDDFGLLTQRDNDYHVWSQFKTFKLSDMSPTASLMKTDSSLAMIGDKKIYNFSSIAMDPMEACHRVDVILIPKFGTNPTFSSVPHDQAMQKIVISSAAMALDKIATINLISSMSMEIPVFSFELSQDSQRNAAGLKEFLSK